MLNNIKNNVWLLLLNSLYLFRITLENVMNDIKLTPHTPICEIAQIIREDWHHVNYGAIPYLDAMDDLHTLDDVYGYDDAKTIIIYFLSNASHWKGAVARQVKAHLKSIVN